MKGLLNLMLVLGAETVAMAYAHHPSDGFLPLFAIAGFLAVVLP